MRRPPEWSPDPLMDPILLAVAIFVLLLIVVCTWLELRKGCREKQKSDPTWWQKGGL